MDQFIFTKNVKTLLLIMLLSVLGEATYAQKVIVTGTVVAQEDESPIAGAIINVKDTSRPYAVFADSLGKFSITVNKGQSIVVAFMGYEAQTFSINASQELRVPLKTNVVAQDEVVVIGYATVKKSHLTGAVSSVSVADDKLDQIPVSRVDDALMGKLAGVSVTQTDAQAGADPTIQVRGATSISASTAPLIVIDGFPVHTDLSSIDMNDVESIEVLKDAASAAIYGSQGGNGVIIVTTKSGKSNTSRTSVNVTSGLKEVYRKEPTQSLDSWKNYVLQQNNGVLPAEIQQAEKINANTDGQDLIFRRSSFSNAAINTSGGNAAIHYYMSGNYTKDDGVIIGNNYSRFGGKFGVDAQLTKKVKAGISITPSYTDFYNTALDVQQALLNLPNWMPEYQTAATAALTGLPIGSYASNRDFSSTYNPMYTGTTIATSSNINPLQTQAATNDETKTLRTLTNYYIQYNNIIPYLSFKTSGGLLTSLKEHDFYRGSTAIADPLIDGQTFAQATSLATVNQTRVTDLLSENMFTYQRAWGKHDLNVLGGYSVQYTVSDSIIASAANFATDQIPTLNAGTMQSLATYQQKEFFESFIGRVMYSYKGIYLFSVSSRWDADSRFGADNRWGYFPAASAGWNIGRETWFPKSDVLSDLKIRASFGATGNKNIPNYRAYATVNPVSYSSGISNVTQGFALTSYSNQDLSWERTYSYNIGTDWTLWKGRLIATFEYYRSYTDDLLLDLPIPSATGFTGYYINKGKVQNQGGEMELTYRVINKRDFTWSLSGNAYLNRNKLLDFGGTDLQVNTGDPKRVSYFITQVGAPLTQFYGYVVDSIVSMKGTNYWPIGVNSLKVFVKDINGDGKIDDKDRTVLGNPYPKFNFGLTSRFRYKRFDLGITVQGSFGAKVFNLDPYYYHLEYGSTGSTAYQNYPLSAQAQTVITTSTNMFIQDASFWAIRNLNVGYTFSQRKIQRYKLSLLRVYISTANLYYHFSNDYTSLNPEANNGFPGDPLRAGYQHGAVPIARTITFGLNTTF